MSCADKMLADARRKKQIIEAAGYTSADARADDLPEEVRHQLIAEGLMEEDDDRDRDW